MGAGSFADMGAGAGGGAGAGVPLPQATSSDVSIITVIRIPNVFFTLQPP